MKTKVEYKSDNSVILSHTPTPKSQAQICANIVWRKYQSELSGSDKRRRKHRKSNAKRELYNSRNKA